MTILDNTRNHILKRFIKFYNILLMFKINEYSVKIQFQSSATLKWA